MNADEQVNRVEGKIKNPQLIEGGFHSSDAESGRFELPHPY